jgi:hypothetical protein
MEMPPTEDVAAALRDLADAIRGTTARPPLRRRLAFDVVGAVVAIGLLRKLSEAFRLDQLPCRPTLEVLGAGDELTVFVEVDDDEQAHAVCEVAYLYANVRSALSR